MNRHEALEFITARDNVLDDENEWWVTAWHNGEKAFLEFADFDNNRKKFKITIEEWS